MFPFSRRRLERGITLIELLVAMAIVALMLAISYPSFTAGLDGIRLKTAVDRAGTFLSSARVESDRRQQPVHVTVDPAKRQLLAVAADRSWEDSLVLDNRIRVVFPRQPKGLVLYPGTPGPEFRVLLGSEQGGRAGLKINIFTGVPEEWDGAGAEDR